MNIFAKIWDLRSIRLDEGPDGMKRSWIMLMPQGLYTHPQYGKLNFSRERLLTFKEHFDQGVRGIEIALDENHDQDKATGWIEAVEWRAPQGDLPAGLWGRIRWTELGEHDISAQIYRYFSPEFGPDRDEKTGETTDDVIKGGGLTNRPFLKDMPAVHLAEPSNTPWGSIDKSSLPRACFLDPGDANDKSTWKLPVYEAGANGGRGKLNLNGVKAAWAAVNGAHTGKQMDVPTSVRSRLKAWMQQYFGNKQATEEARRGIMATRKKGAKSESEWEFDEENQQFNADGEEYDEELDEGDGDGDGDEGGDGLDPQANRHGPLTIKSHSHGKFAGHGHNNDGNHEGVPLKETKMHEHRPTPRSPQRMREAQEVVQLREQLLAQGRKLYAMEVNEILQAWETGQVFTFDEQGSRVKDPSLGETKKRTGRIAITPKGARAVRAFMLEEGFTLAESTRGAVLDLVQTLLSEQLVDLSARGGSLDMEARKTIRGGKRDEADPQTEVSLAETAKILANADNKVLSELSVADRERYFLRAAQEVGY